MQATKITWDDKVGLIPRKIRINQCQDRDLNEIKTAVNNNADLLDQFTFSDPLGNIGIGGTPTAKLSVIGTSPGQDLFDVTDDAGNTRFKVDGNGLVGIGRSPEYNLDISGNFRVSSTLNLTGGYIQFPGSEWAAIRHTGSLFTIGPNSISSSVISIDVLTGQIGLGSTLNTEISSVVHVASTTKGAINAPRMTEAQRLAITSPATGLHVYQTDGTEGVYVNKSTGWVFAY